jgi:uncharacterized protein
MKLAGTIAIAAPSVEVWALIINPITLSACVPGVQDIRQIDDRTFEGTVTASVGPIDGNFSFRSVMTRAAFPDDLVVAVEGTDSVTKSRLQMDVVVAVVASSAAATELTYQAEIRVKGRLAILGEMVLRATAGMMIGEVTRCLRSQLEPPSATLGSTSASS